MRDDGKKIQWTFTKAEWQNSANIADAHHVNITELLEVIRIVGLLFGSAS